jgi:hypothetical protein
MYRQNTTRDEEDIGRGHEAQRLYRQQLMYYTISRTFIGTPSIIVSYGFPQYLTGFPLFLEKVLSFTELDHHAIAKVLREDIPFLIRSYVILCPIRACTHFDLSHERSAIVTRIYLVLSLYTPLDSDWGRQ